jgi:hypothetical protein
MPGNHFEMPPAAPVPLDPKYDGPPRDLTEFQLWVKFAAAVLTATASHYPDPAWVSTVADTMLNEARKRRPRSQP